MSQTSRLVWLALDRIPARQREVLVLHEIEARTLVEIAALLDVPHGTVKSRLRVARGRFKAAMLHVERAPGPNAALRAEPTRD